MSLASLVLTTRAVGIDDLHQFPFLDLPDPAAIHEATEILHFLGALDAKNQLTSFGWRMLGLPLDPRLARILFAAEEEHCLDEALTICAALGSRGIFREPRDRAREARTAYRVFHTDRSDPLTLLTIFRAWQGAGQSPQWCEDYFVRSEVLQEIAAARKQLVDLLEQRGVRVTQTQPADRTAMDRALIAGFGDQLWHRSLGHRYQRGPGEHCALERRSAAYADPPEWILAMGLFRTHQLLARGAHPVSPELVAETLHRLHQQTGGSTRQLRYSEDLDAVTILAFTPTDGGSVERTVVQVTGQEAQAFLADALVEGRLSTAATAANRVILRELDALRTRMSARVVPPISTGMLRAFYLECLGTAVSLKGAEQCDLHLSPEVLRPWLGRGLDALHALKDQAYPESLILLGRTYPVRYEEGVGTVTLTPEVVTALPYDEVVLQDGSPVQIEMPLLAPDGQQEARVTSASVRELKEVLAARAQEAKNRALLQRRCDELRERLRLLRQTRLLLSATDDSLRTLLSEAEAAVYAWTPDLGKAVASLERMEARLKNL